MRHLALGMLVWPAGLALAAFSGCAEGTHQVDRAGPGADQHVIGCQKCYDEVKVVRQDFAKGALPSRNQVIRTHQCPDCKTAMTTYMQDGTPMIKCARCAPEGVACDKCLPPKGS
ncbi:MAG: hypothetical protein AMXMBFR83_22630 [Phycisphaerae bacterium]